MAALLNKLCINQAFNQMPKGKLLEEMKFLFPARKKFVSLIASRLSTENRHFRLHLTPVVRSRSIFVR